MLIRAWASLLIAVWLAVPLSSQTQESANAAGKPKNLRQINTDHLQITTYSTEDVVGPGSTVSFVFEVIPRKGIHVYAPGDHTYKIVRFNLQRDPRVSARPLEYPPSEMYTFAPLNERVPVFQHPFRIEQRIDVGTSREQRAALAKGERMTLRGTLEYQACDDRVCFLPQSIPVSYTFRVRRGG